MLSILLFVAVSFAEQFKDCKVAYCAFCNEVGTCDECFPGYILNNGKCTFLRELGCETFGYDENDNYYCKTCAHGYKFDTSGKCVLGNEICSDFDTDDLKCKECKQPAVMSKTDVCVDCTDKIEYCKEYTLDQNGNCICTQCVMGAQVNTEGKCEVVNEFVSEDGCQPGYFEAHDGICMKGNIKDCKDYTDEEMCGTCINKQSAIHGKCYVCEMENCRECTRHDEQDVCAKCDKGYYVNKDGECSEKPANCKSVENNLGRCATCEEGYRSNEYGKCVKCSQTGCADCYLVYNEENGYKEKCRSCMEGYHEDQTQSDSDVCKKNIDHCIEHNDENKCTRCEPGYSRNEEGTACVDNKGCYNYDETNNFCKQCQAGFYMKNDYTCGKCSDECEEGCVHSANECYGYDDIEYCLFRGKDHKCAKCESGYELKDGICDNKSDYCAQQTGTGKCTLCIAYKIIENEQGEEEEDTSYVHHNYFPDSDYECGTTSMFLMMILAIIAFVF